MKMMKLSKKQLSKFDNLNSLKPNSRYSCKVIGKRGTNKIPFFDTKLENSMMICFWEKGSDTISINVRV
jgi:hypothetical protein